MRIRSRRRPTGYGLALVLAASCRDLAGDFDPFDVTVNVLGRGNGSGVVTEVETTVTINCHIVAGEPNELSEIADAGNPCRSVFTDLNGLGMFLLFAAPDAGHEFVGWSGDCAVVQGTTCQVSFVSREAITLTVYAEFRPVGLIIAAPSDTFSPHGAVAKW